MIKQAIRIHCPVCNEYLGDRFEGTVFEGHCIECKATFTFTPGDNKPTVFMDCTKKKYCDCSNCRKDAEETPQEVQPYILPPEDEDWI